MIANRIVVRMRKAGLYGLAAMILVVGCHKDISGAYLSTDKSGVCWLQLVRTPDNHLSGQLSASILKPDGTIQQSSVSVTGAVDGENLTLSASRFLGLDELTLSGTLSGDTLTLTGSQPIPVTFKRSKLSEYQVQVTDLNSRSQSILHAKAVAQAQQRAFQIQATFVSAVDRLIGQMGQFDSQADLHLGRAAARRVTSAREMTNPAPVSWVDQGRRLYGLASRERRTSLCTIWHRLSLGGPPADVITPLFRAPSRGLRVENVIGNGAHVEFVSPDSHRPASRPARA